MKSESMVEHYNDLFFNVYRQFTPRRILEIGVFRGGSLAIWLDMFSGDIVGVDLSMGAVAPACHAHFAESGRVNLITMNCSSPEMANLGRFDLIIDDGGHGFENVRRSFEILWPNLGLGGLYIVEDWRLRRFNPMGTLGYLSELLIGNEELEFASPEAPAKLTIYRGLIVIEKKIVTQVIEKRDAML